MSGLPGTSIPFVRWSKVLNKIPPDSIRENGASTILQPTNSIAQTIQALDNLEIAASTNSILRRYHLTRLVDHRNERESYHKTERPERAVRIVKDSSEGYGRASSLALEDLMAQAYLKLKSLPRGRSYATMTVLRSKSQ
jgi:hypothetical protein